MLRKFYYVCLTAALWTLVWGLVGATTGAIVTVFQPDTRHIPSDEMPILIGVPSSIFGFGAGLLYGALAVAFGAELSLRKTGRPLLGAGVGLVVGIAFMRILAHSYLTILLAILLGVLLAGSPFLGKFLQPKKDVVRGESDSA